MADRTDERLAALEQRVAELEARLMPKAPPPPMSSARIREDWQPDEPTLLWIRERFPDVDEQEERDKFRDYWLSRSESRRDWGASYRMWIRKAREINERDRSRPRQFGSGRSRTADIDAGNRARIDGALDRFAPGWKTDRS
jgi:hypothetical protein